MNKGKPQSPPLSSSFWNAVKTANSWASDSEDDHRLGLQRQRVILSWLGDVKEASSPQSEEQVKTNLGATNGHRSEGISTDFQHSEDQPSPVPSRPATAVNGVPNGALSEVSMSSASHPATPVPDRAFSEMSTSSASHPATPVNGVPTGAPSVVSSSSCTAPSRPHYPVVFYKVLLEEAADRFVEASRFFYHTGVYCAKMEFHIRILEDLCGELDDPPAALEPEDHAAAGKLRRQMRFLRMNLVEYRKVLLGRGSTKSGSSGSEEVTVYAEVADQAKAARQRLCEMAVLLEKLTEFSVRENRCKQRRFEITAELQRYFQQVFSNEHDHQRHDEADSTENSQTTDSGN